MPISFFFFFNDTATTEIYTLSLHDALPIWVQPGGARRLRGGPRLSECLGERPGRCRAALSLDVQLAARVPRHGLVSAQPDLRGSHDAAGGLTGGGKVGGGVGRGEGERGVEG